MSERTCGNCRWWNRHSGLSTGDCQKRPPNSITSKWPSTDEVDFCGEWADKNITPEQAERRELIKQFALAIVTSDTNGNMPIRRVWQVAAELADYEGQT